MIAKILLILYLLITFSIFISTESAKIIHNSFAEIANCTNKINLKLVKIWNDDETEDENEFFKTPIDLCRNSLEETYIVDYELNVIKSFDKSNGFIMNIGKKGQGPGDLFVPMSIVTDKCDNLIVLDSIGKKVQFLNRRGKYLSSFKLRNYSDSMEIGKDGEIVIYSHYETFRNRRILSIYNKSGKFIKRIGIYHDKSKIERFSESLSFSIGPDGNYYIFNDATPVIRKYSKNGNLTKAFTYNIRNENNIIKLNKQKNEIITNNINRKGKVMGAAIDSANRIFLYVKTRSMTEKERLATRIEGTPSSINRKYTDQDLLNNMDLGQLLVFSPSGKIIAKNRIKGYGGKMYIHKDRIFIIEGFVTQTIKEYEFKL